MARRRLRRMGFRDAADWASADTILKLQQDFHPKPKRYLRWIELAVLIIGLLIWLLIFIRPYDPDGTKTGQFLRFQNADRSAA